VSFKEPQFDTSISYVTEYCNPSWKPEFSSSLEIYGKNI